MSKDIYLSLHYYYFFFSYWIYCIFSPKSICKIAKSIIDTRTTQVCWDVPVRTDTIPRILQYVKSHPVWVTAITIIIRRNPQEECSIPSVKPFFYCKAPISQQQARYWVLMPGCRVVNATVFPRQPCTGIFIRDTWLWRRGSDITPSNRGDLRRVTSRDPSNLRSGGRGRCEGKRRRFRSCEPD